MFFAASLAVLATLQGVNAQAGPYTIRLTNAAYTPWRPHFYEIEAYKDAECTERVIPDSYSTVAIDGYEWDNVYGTYTTKGLPLAFDGSLASSFRPNCHNCDPEEIKIDLSFSDYVSIRCVKVPGLGSAGTYPQGGFKVYEKKNDLTGSFSLLLEPNATPTDTSNTVTASVLAQEAAEAAAKEEADRLAAEAAAKEEADRLAAEAAAARTVTFRLNMQGVDYTGIPTLNGVFNGWCGDCNPLTDDDGDGIFEVTLENFSAGSTHEYLFAIGNWVQKEDVPVECQAESSPNRKFEANYPSDGGDLVLPVVGWSSCTSDPVSAPVSAARTVTFRLNMQGVDYTGIPTLNGVFNGWCGDCNPLTDDDGDGIFEVTLENFSAGSTHEYLFAIGNWVQKEDVPVECQAESSPNRKFEANYPSDGGDLVLPVVGWSSCTSDQSTSSGSHGDFEPPLQGEMPPSCSNIASPTSARSLAFTGSNGYVACIRGSCYLVHPNHVGSWTATPSSSGPWQNEDVPDLHTVIGVAGHTTLFYNSDGRVVIVHAEVGGDWTYHFDDSWVCPEGELYAAVHCDEDDLLIGQGGNPYHHIGVGLVFDASDDPTISVFDNGNNEAHTIQLECQCDE